MNLTLEVTHPAYVMMSSDFSQQEPKLTATVSQCPQWVEAFNTGKDVYATISSIALGVPYEECLEFNPKTGEVNPEGKARRSMGKVLNLGEPIGFAPYPESYAHSAGALLSQTVEKKNFVNCITHRCASDD